MIKWLYILIPLSLGGIAYEIMEPRHWGSIKQGLMLALSLLGAAVLVRLARGMPVSNTEYFEVEEMRRLSNAVKQIYLALIALFIAILSSLAGLVFIEVAQGAIGNSALFGPETKHIAQQLSSAALVFLVSFALIRTLPLIVGDYDLVKLQSSYMERAVERRHAAHHIAAMDGAAASKPFEKRPGYGKTAQ